MDAHERVLENEGELLAAVYNHGDTYTVVRLTGTEEEDPERGVRLALLRARGYRRCGLLGWRAGKMDAEYGHDPVSLRAMRCAGKTFAVAMAGQTVPPLTCPGVTGEWLEALYAFEDNRIEATNQD